MIHMHIKDTLKIHMHAKDCKTIVQDISKWFMLCCGSEALYYQMYCNVLIRIPGLCISDVARTLPQLAMTTKKKKKTLDTDNVPWRAKSCFISQLRKPSLGDSWSNLLNIKIFCIFQGKKITNVAVTYYIEVSSTKAGYTDFQKY